MGCGNSSSSNDTPENAKGRDVSKNSSLKINKKYILGEQLGSGASCFVYFAQRKSDNMKVAVKILSKEGKHSQQFWRDEVNILSQLNHPNILS